MVETKEWSGNIPLTTSPPDARNPRNRSHMRKFCSFKTSREKSLNSQAFFHKKQIALNEDCQENLTLLNRLQGKR
jgi:hypothetical protein